MKSLNWLRQPTTLQGLSLIIAGEANAQNATMARMNRATASAPQTEGQ